MDNSCPIKRNIVLTGFMGTGKSTVGKLLAENLKYNFVDTDGLISESAGLDIPSIFEIGGEEYFRALERETIERLLDFHQGEYVIATGGGSVISGKNRNTMKKAGIILLLTAAPDAILERIGHNLDRPLLKGENAPETIKRLLKERDPYYRDCCKAFETTGKSAEIVCKEILAFIGKREMFF